MCEAASLLVNRFAWGPHSGIGAGFVALLIFLVVTGFADDLLGFSCRCEFALVIKVIKRATDQTSRGRRVNNVNRAPNKRAMPITIISS